MFQKISLVIFLSFYITTFSNDRILYVDNFNNILGSPTKEDNLLSFAKKNNFNSLILYQLNKIDERLPLTDSRKNKILSEFISRAKLKYGIRKIGASGESATFFFDKIEAYNNSRPKIEEKFNVYNLEFEYWSKKATSNKGYYCEGYLRDNKQPCNRQGAFKYFLDNLKVLKKLSEKSKYEISVEAYVGYYTQTEISKISDFCDQIVVHSSGKNPKSCLNSAKKNLDNLSKINANTKVTIFFSTRMNAMGYWFKYNSLDKSEKQFINEIHEENNISKDIINIHGFAYHTYSYLERSISYYSYSRN